MGRLAVAALLAVLSGCGSDCPDCGYPGEVSFGLVAGDFTGDGRTLLITTSTVQEYWVNPGSLKVYTAAGGAFGSPLMIPDGNDPLYLASADLNGDHLADVVSASYHDEDLAVFFNSPGRPGSFAAPLLLHSPGASQVAIGDLNGDGLPDLVSADYYVSLFVQSAPDQFGAPVGLYSQGAYWVAIGDLNGDGLPDLALADDFGVKLMMHSGDPSSAGFAAPVGVFTASYNAHVVGANQIAISDLNGDGLNDLVITDPGPTGEASPTVAVMLQSPAAPGQFQAPVQYALASHSVPQSIAVADVNGDGLPDIVTGGSGAVSVLLQGGGSPGGFAAAVNYPVWNANEIALADVNGDGRLDVLIGTGPLQAAHEGVIPNVPGVLLQQAGAPGTFGALQALP